MALVACKECKKEISDGAYRCPQCGAKQRMHNGWWFVIVPAVLFAAVVGYGFTIPDHVAKANRMRDTCEKLIGGPGGPRQYECDRIYSDEMAKGAAAGKR